ncbi:MAG: hypothetical protein IJ439_03600 [Tyzzerella sp.]|nr:hypothetical protein [Tyzzerella sp.]
MTMIKGMTVIIRKKVQTGTDAFNRPVYDYKDENVENVLVAPASSDDITTSQDLYGKKAVYTLGIPKGDTHDWKDTIVVFFGQEWNTFGYPLEGIEENIPLVWNKKVMVEHYE